MSHNILPALFIAGPWLFGGLACMWWEIRR